MLVFKQILLESMMNMLISRHYFNRNLIIINQLKIRALGYPYREKPKTRLKMLGII